MPTIDELESKTDKLGVKYGHAMRLLQAMGGSSEGWEWSGDIVDNGIMSNAHCACGHPIRWGFPLVHPHKESITVGSTCVEHAPYMSETLITQMASARETLSRQIAEAKAREKARQQDEEIAVLWNLREDLLQRCREAWRDAQSAPRRAYVSRPLWLICNGYSKKAGLKCTSLEKYSKRGMTIKALESDIDILKRIQEIKIG